MSPVLSVNYSRLDDPDWSMSISLIKNFKYESTNFKVFSLWIFNTNGAFANMKWLSAANPYFPFFLIVMRNAR